MHYLHCILVHFDEPIEEPAAVETMTDEARRMALEATEDYYNQAFDWRSDDAGRWADEYPRRGVVLGATDPEQFFTLLDKWRKKPLENVLKYLNQVRYTKEKWRTKEQIEKDGAVVLPEEDNRNGNLFWSAIPVPEKELVISEDLFNRLWETADLWGFALHRAIALVVGDYVIESQFYSVPDESPKISDTTLEDAREHPEEYALVFPDYHW